MWILKEMSGNRFLLLLSSIGSSQEGYNSVQGSIYWRGGGEASPPTKKSFTEKKLQLFQIKIFLDDDFKESVKVLMSRNAISANPEHYIFKLFWGNMPPEPPRRPKKIFLVTAWLKNFFQD